MMENHREQLIKFKSIQIIETNPEVANDLKLLLKHLSESGFLVECPSKGDLRGVAKNSLEQVAPCGFIIPILTIFADIS